MKICAVILNYRGASMTEACLLSLAGQGIHRVLVVDNSANDHASVELNGAIQRVSAKGIDFSLDTLRPVVNLGFARGVNLALASREALDCDVFLLLNNDATASQNMVLKLSAMLVDHHADLVAPTIIDEQGETQSVFWYQRFFGLLTKRPIVGAFPYLSGCCLLFKRELLQEGKLFDEDFFMYGEDTLLGWRLARAGKVVLRSENAVVQHLGQGSSEQCKMFYEYHMARVHVLLAFKTFCNPLELPLLIAAKAAGLAMRAVRRSIRYSSGIPLVAFFLAWLPLNIHKP